ncbi:MAG TPA: peptidylprolyl isomerase [Verrucomicrobiae bacterium]|nr:peptidylprolyl isomerase [Verrucomicrobiae bacterium]
MRLMLLALLCLAACAQQPVAPPAGRASAQVLEASAPSDWRRLDPEDTIYLELASGRVVIELAPAFAPLHAQNIKALAREQYFDGLVILRSQDNYVVQWGDPAEDEKKARPIRSAKSSLPPEFAREATPDLPFSVLADGDVYAPEAGHSTGFPAARGNGKAWLAHCYGMLGVSRGNTADSGSGAGLYVVIGHSPRHLDRNITLAGRVVKGMELLSALPRGTGALGFYENPEQHVKVRALRVAADLPASQRTELELLRTDTATWTEYVDSRRWRREEWFLDKVGHVELCNVPLPVREKK